MQTLMKNGNNFEVAKVQPGVAYKSVAYKKKCVAEPLDVQIEETAIK